MHAAARALTARTASLYAELKARKAFLKLYDSVRAVPTGKL